MSLEDLYVGGSERGIDGLEYGFADRFYDMLMAMPEHLRGMIKIKSGYRSVQEQETLYQRGITKYGQDGVGKWVAPPGRSNHNKGMAMDLVYIVPAAQRWAHENAHRFGLKFPMKHEPWHIEPLGLRDKSYRGTGRTWDGNPSDLPGFADPDAYTDGQGLNQVDNHSLETQMLRVADFVLGGTGRVEEMRARTSSAKNMADRNSGFYESDS